MLPERTRKSLDLILNTESLAVAWATVGTPALVVIHFILKRSTGAPCFCSRELNVATSEQAERNGI